MVGMNDINGDHPVIHFLAQVCNSGEPSMTPSTYIEQLRKSGEFTETELCSIEESIVKALRRSIQSAGGSF